jgi:hypothetical protein
VVALAQDIKITTRHLGEPTYQVDFDDQWLSDDDWRLPVYEVDPIDKGTTFVELQKLRLTVTDEEIEQLRDHLGATYAKFLSNQSVAINLNGKARLLLVSCHH